MNLRPREQEILALVADGLRSHEIAERLGISEETVKDHVKRAIRTLGARNRPHAVAVALRRQVIA